MTELILCSHFNWAIKNRIFIMIINLSFFYIRRIHINLLTTVSDGLVVRCPNSLRVYCVRFVGVFSKQVHIVDVPLLYQYFFFFANGAANKEEKTWRIMKFWCIINITLELSWTCSKVSSKAWHELRADDIRMNIINRMPIVW